MIQKNYRQSFILLLITAFLSLQWSSSHIHLAAYHDHDGEHHQHNVTAHNHQLTKHQDVIDSASDVHINELVSHESHTVVEIEQLCISVKVKYVDQLAVLPVLLAADYRLYKNHNDLIKFVTSASYNSYLDSSTVLSRAPPSFS